ncbi:MAG: tRNA (adenosine(37)-N6)-threonylcarbamoyltransferase complex ATPase subunit type 1 TsaE [Spirochaetes bacterium]|nr:tRNA (adenosine(37)-N6)-threonylcarbamoyltransferase complex ATPase subunit type 1 TsaE [Spirochaetota bacterium]
MTREIGRTLASNLKAGSILLLDGGLGSGKTTFAQGVAEGLGIVEPLLSPTYLYVVPYEGKLPLYHIDLYRVEDEEFLEELGLRELLHGNGVSIVEWWSKFPAFFPEHGIRVTLTILPEGNRSITIKGWYP